jgi:hypothetical protein
MYLTHRRTRRIAAATATATAAALLLAAPLTTAPAWSQAPSATAASAEGDEKPKVGMMVVVRPIQMSRSLQERLAQRKVDFVSIRDGLTDDLLNGMTQNGLTVVRRDAADALLQEQGLSYTNIVDPATAAQAGKFVGARYVCLATVEGTTEKQLFNTVFKVNIRYAIINVQTGTMVKLPGGDGVCEGKQSFNALQEIAEIAKMSDDWRQSAFGKAAAKAITDLGKEFQSVVPALKSWQVLRRSGDEHVIIDGGSETNLKEGMKLVICHVEDEDGFVVETEIAEAEAEAVQQNRTKLKITRVIKSDVKIERGFLVRPPKGTASPVASAK